MFKKVCIIGCGLIGSSIARAIKKKNLAIRVVSWPDKANLAPRNAPIAPAPYMANFIGLASDCSTWTPY